MIWILHQLLSPWWLLIACFKLSFSSSWIWSPLFSAFEFLLSFFVFCFHVVVFSLRFCFFYLSFFLILCWCCFQMGFLVGLDEGIFLGIWWSFQCWVYSDYFLGLAENCWGFDSGVLAVFPVGFSWLFLGYLQWEFWRICWVVFSGAWECRFWGWFYGLTRIFKVLFGFARALFLGIFGGVWLGIGCFSIKFVGV